MKLVQLITLSCLAAVTLVHAEDESPQMRDQSAWLQQICASPDNWSAPPGAEWTELPAETISARGRDIGERRLWREPDAGLVRVDRLNPSGRPGRWILEYHDNDSQPTHFIGLDDQCRLRAVRRLRYQNGLPMALEVMNDEFSLITEELLNPAIPAVSANSDPGTIPVAMVDAGVNYLLPEIRERMAVGANGETLGYDFWDMDPEPFDAHVAASPFFIQRHGTRTASIVLNEAPMASLVSYRYPRPSMDRMADLVHHAAGLGVRIVGLPLGSNRRDDWTAFEMAARKQPDMLFIASAGNNGRDIDREPVYPAALDLPNLLTVSSSDESLGPAQGSNYGGEAVDYLLPAERLDALDFRGNPRPVSGSSYAVSRLVALAARLLANRPSMTIDELQAAIAASALPALRRGHALLGVIPDPLADVATVNWNRLPSEDDSSAAGNPGGSDKNSQEIPLRILLLDPAWEVSEVTDAVNSAADLLMQCEVSLVVSDSLQFDGSDYLRDLESGAAKTLLQSLPADKGKTIDVVFARDSRLNQVYDGQAFGLDNTRTRPWLRNSVWVLPGTENLSLVVAHEIFHVLSNNGSHAPSGNNLMAAEITAESSQLTPAQCALARSYLRRVSS